MPHVIQPGGGGGKMRMRYTTRRKRGIIATSKRMMAEGMTLCAAASEQVLPPPPKNKSKLPLEKRSRHAISRPFQPKLRLAPIDCHVVCAGDRADRSI